MRTLRREFIALGVLTLVSVIGACSIWPPGTPTPTSVLVLPSVTHTDPPPPPTYTDTPEPPTHTPTPEVGGPFRRFPLPAGFPHETLTILQASPDGRLFLRSGQTILVLAYEVWSIYLSDFSGTLVGLDSLGRAWVVDDSGSEIAAWDGNEWTTYGEAEGWALLEDYGDGRTETAIVSDDSDRVWLGTGQDVRKFDGSGWRIFTPENMGLSPRGEGGLLATFMVASLECSWRSAGAEVSSGCTTVIQDDDQGRVWLGLDGDLWRYEPLSADWTQFASPDSPMGGSSFFNWVPVIVLDPANDPWAELLVCGGGGCGGEMLYHLHDGTWTLIMEMNSHYFRKLVFDGLGTPWLFVDAYSWDEPGEIYLIVDDQLELEAQMRLRAMDVTVDVLGRIWFVVEGADDLELWVLEPYDE
jgi:hypothetical protein